MNVRMQWCLKARLCFALLLLAACSKPTGVDDQAGASDRAASAAKIAASQKAREEEVDCSNGGDSNMDMIVCNSIELRQAEAELDQYLKASRASLIVDIANAKEFDPKTDSDKALAEFGQAQRDWLSFVRNKCRSETLYFGGSNSSNENLRCYLAETKYRTLMLWQSWLTYADSTPPKWPRPKFDFGYIEWDGVNR